MNSIYFDIISYVFNFPKQSTQEIASGTERNFMQVQRTLDRLKQVKWVTDDHEVTTEGAEAAVNNVPSPLDPSITRKIGYQGGLSEEYYKDIPECETW